MPTVLITKANGLPIQKRVREEVFRFGQTDRDMRDTLSRVYARDLEG